MFLLNFTSAIDNIGTFPTGQDFELIQFCDSCTYVNLSAIQYPNGTLQNINEEMTKTDYNYNYTFSTDTAGDYTYSVCGDKDGGLKCETFTFSINEGGVEITDAGSTLAIGLLAILVIFLIGGLFGFFATENYIGKLVFYWISHILIVLISFVGWQIGVEGILGGTALTGIFRILFWVFTVAILPMIFVSLAWIVHIHAYNEHFQKLIEKGVDTEEAFRMTTKKKGWMNGV